MMISADELRLAMRHWATGVTIVTAQFNGTRHGMTVNSFTSISLEPPLVLVSLERMTRTRQIVTHSGFFGVTVLKEGQLNISDRFAGRDTEFQDRFAGLETFSLISEVPLIRSGLVSFDCQVSAQHEAGTHTIFIGKVLAIKSSPIQEPLIYHNQAYRQLLFDD